MTRETLPIVLAILLFGFTAFLAVRERLNSRRHQLRVRKLYASPVFDSLLPLLKVARKRHIEQVVIDKTGVLFSFLSPVGSNLGFMMKEYGFQYLSLEQQEAMRTVLEECLPQLRDHKLYRVNRKRITLLNGEVEFVCRYIIQNTYKVKLIRAPYYDAALRTRMP